MVSGISLDDRYTVPGRHWHPLDDGRVQCDVCPRACRLHEGQRGLCFVRGAGGRPDGAHHVRSVERVLRGPDREEAAQPFPARVARCCRSAPRAATWPAGSARTGTSPSRGRSTGSPTPPPRTTIAEAAVRLGCRSVAFTYNDPVIFLEYAIDVADACRARGIKAVAVTAGYMTAEPRRELLRPHGRGQRGPQGVHRGLLPPGLRRRTCSRCWTRWSTCAQRDRRVVRDHHAADPRAQRLRRRDRRRVRVDRRPPRRATCRCTSPRSTPTTRCATCRRTPPATLRRAREIALRHGLRYVYTGNVHDAEGGRTTCPGCGAAVIERDWYRIDRLPAHRRRPVRRLRRALPGRFDGPVGRWGPPPGTGVDHQQART